MKKFGLFICLVLTSLLFVVPVNAKESERIKVYLFYGDGCPHCAAEKELLNDLKEKYEFDVKSYETWKNAYNRQFMEEVKGELHCTESGVPLTIIGETIISGYSDATGNVIERAIKFYQTNEYEDVVQQIKDGTYVYDENNQDEFWLQEEEEEAEVTVDVPVAGKLNLRNVSLTTAAVVLGLIDGFNPCAMWVLLFLISMLLGMKDKRRMWIIGLTFLLSSALIYMLMMLSWINIVVEISTSIILRNIVAVIAIAGGGINLYNYFKHQDSGCSVVDEKKRKNVFARIKKFTKEKSLVLALIGTVALAVSVNIIELACSAGLPLVFSQLLALNEVTGFASFLYVLLYIVFFLLDDLAVFFVAMRTMEVTGISTKYSKYSHLIGGILMVIIGILLIVKPEWLMFQFV